MKPESHTPKFLAAASEARVGTVRWTDRVIIGSDAIYIFQRRRRLAGGVLIVFELLAEWLLPKKNIDGTPYIDLPESIRSDPDWPVQTPVACPVFVIPKSSVQFLYHNRGRYEVRFIHAATEFAIPHNEFSGKGIKSFLQANGWPVVWNGEKMNIKADAQLIQGRLGDVFRRPYISAGLVGGGILVGMSYVWMNTLGVTNRDLISVVSLTGFAVGFFLFLLGIVANLRGL